jgi:alcohol dehydrogenase (cytochrome c)
MITNIIDFKSILNLKNNIMKTTKNLFSQGMLSIAFVGGLLSNVHAQTAQSGDWASYNRTLAGDRYSPLNQINAQNVASLKLVGSFDLQTDINSFQTGPLVVSGIMYFTTNRFTYAVNAATGKLVWKKERSNAATAGYGANRGVAYLDGKLFRGTSDSHVLGMNAKDGSILWDVKLDVSGQPGVAIPMAPIAYKGMVFVGTAGGDLVGVTGHVYALDASDGHVIWKFDTITNYADNPKTSTGIPVSGGGYWTSFGLDEATGILYAPAGNPAPDFDIEARGEDLKYFNYLIALDIKTGKVIASKQLVKNDIHDWDVSAPPVVFTTKEGRKLVASANKNGLLSVLDIAGITNDPNGAEKTIPLIYEVPTTTRLNTDVQLSREVWTYFKPGYLGGNEWNGPAYDPQTNIIYTGADDWGLKAKLAPLDSVKNRIPAPGSNWFGTKDLVTDDPKLATGWLTAFDAKDGSEKWKYHTTGPILAGVTPTAGGLVFTASMNGEVYAFDAATGKILWKGTTNLINGGGVITYSVNGKQYLAVAAGMKSDLWFGTAKNSKIFIYSL